MFLNECTGGRMGCIISSGDGASTVDDAARPARRHRALLSSLLAAVSTVALSAGAAQAAADDGSRKSSDEQAAVQALMAKIQSMEQRINGLQAELKEAKASSGSKTSRAPSIAQSASLASRTPTDAAQPFADVKSSGAQAKFLPVADLRTPPPLPSKNDKDLFGVGASPVPGLKIGMYGEI